MTASLFDFASLPAEFSLRLVLIRHGEPVQEAKGKCYGSLDVGLSDLGRKQIQDKLASILNLRAQALYASPLKRAVESATIIATELHLDPTLTNELREINFGRFEGLAYEQVEKLYPEQYKMWMERPTEIEFPEGESFAQMKTRVLGFKDSLLRTHHRETVVAVSHGGANRIILAGALAIPDYAIFRIAQSYAALNIVDYLGESHIVHLVNG